MNYLTRAKHLLRDLNVEGCRIDEIVDLEKELDMFLPEAYKEFLLWIGKDTNKFLQGSEVEYKHLVKIQGGANELLKENGHPRLPDNAFVFHIHQGYQFSYFLLDGNDDPEVYFYDEVITRGVESLEKPYSSWLATEAEIHCMYWRAENYEKN